MYREHMKYISIVENCPVNIPMSDPLIMFDVMFSPHVSDSSPHLFHTSPYLPPQASEVCVEVAGPVPGPRGPRKGFRLESICWD